MNVPASLWNAVIYSREGQPVRELEFTDELRRLLYDRTAETKQTSNADNIARDDHNPRKGVRKQWAA